MGGKNSYSMTAHIFNPPKISGYVRTPNGIGIDDVTLSFSNSGGTTTTRYDGYYNNETTYNWSGTVTPYKSGYTFIPSERRYDTLVIQDQLDQDYTGIPTDTDGDGLNDNDEINTYGTNPNKRDSDDDGINDLDEVAYWGDNWNADYDDDGLINVLDPDAVGDELCDGEEINVYGTDPAISDTDADGVDDKNDIFPLDPLRWTHDITPIIMPLLLSPIVEVENVNSYLSGTPDPSTFSFDLTPVPGGPAGTFSFSADFCNIGDKALTGLKTVTVCLSGNNALLNRDSGTPPGVGSELTFPKTGGLADSKLEPCECVRVDYKIGMENRVPFQFFTDVFGFKQ